MCHMPRMKFFKKTQNLDFFQKRGQKNENFEKMYSKSKRALKIGYKTCATCPEQNFSKKLKILFFSKKGPRGQKNENFEKIFSKSKRASKLDIKHVPHAPNQNFQKNSKFLFFSKKGPQRQ